MITRVHRVSKQYNRNSQLYIRLIFNTCPPKMSLHPKRTLLLTCIFLLSFGNRYEVIVSASEQQNTHQISFNDCSDSRIVHRLSTDGACQAPPVSNKTRGEYQLLQQIGYQTVDGWSCEIRHSTFEFYCGVYSHLKLIKIPDIEISLPVTPGECRKFVNQHKYRTKNGGSHSRGDHSPSK